MHKEQKGVFVCLLLALLLTAFPFSSAAKEYEPANVIEIDIGIRPSAYRKLLSGQETEPTFPVKVCVGDSLPFDGSLKLRGHASKGFGLATPQKRLPVQLKIGQTDLLAGSLDNPCIKIINAYTPHRLLGEYLALELYRSLRVPTPAYDLVFLRYNGVDFGLFLAAEDVNDTFLKKTYPDGGGSLFKADYRYDETDHVLSSWFGSLQIVKNRGTERFDALVDALTRGTGYEALLDVDETLRYFACVAAWGADGSILTEGNNFFLYDDGSKFHLIPWDNSEAFAGYPTENGIDRFQMAQWKEPYAPPLFTLLMQEEANRERYHAYIRQINDEFLAPERIDPYFNALAAAIQPYLQKDGTMFFNQPYTVPVSPTENAYGTVDALLGTLHAIHDNLTAQLAGKTDRFYGNPAYPADIDFAEDIDTIAGYFASQSPLLQPDITEKICAAYSAWCRAHGRIPFDADDPVEIAAATVLFLAAFGLTAALTKKKVRKKNNREAKPK